LFWFWKARCRFLHLKNIDLEIVFQAALFFWNLGESWLPFLKGWLKGLPGSGHQIKGENRRIMNTATSAGPEPSQPTIITASSLCFRDVLTPKKVGEDCFCGFAGSLPFS
jgi:hypothetical protein